MQDKNSQPTVTIEWLHDEHECDTCGTSFADGAIVTLNDETILEMIPHAHCFGGCHWNSEEVYKLILEKLGYEILEDY